MYEDNGSIITKLSYLYFFYTFSFIKRCNGFIENTIIQLSLVHFKLSFFEIVQLNN